jgi:RNA polymerase primary sigma factor/RNA polymerase sigma factor
MHTDYLLASLRQLRDHEVEQAPRERQMEYVDRAERLLSEIDPKRNYSFDFVCQRLTEGACSARKSQKCAGKDLQHDLRLWVEDLSDAANVAADTAGEPVLTVEDLSKRYNVSTKTVSRWRQQGLVSRRFVFDGRKRVGFLRSSVERFVTANEDRVRRGSSFSQLDDAERDQIIERSRRLIQAGACPAEAMKRVARRFDRSVETVRYTIKQFDGEHPDNAVFPEHSGTLADHVKQRIYQQYRRGITVDALAKQHCRTKTSIYRVINEMRARQILDLPLDFIPSPEFEKANADRVILTPMPASPTAPRAVRLPSGLPPYLQSLYEVPLLNREQEGHLFRKYNYLKYRAGKLRNQIDPLRPKSALMDEIEGLHQQAIDTKNQIIRANLRLVVSIAKRHVGAAGDFFELVSDGNVSLMRAVEKFDYGRGNKFSTYATWAIMKNYARTIPDEHRQRDRFRTSHDEMFSATQDVRSDQFELELAQRSRETQIGRILDALDEREQKIIISRFGLERGHEPLTLKEVGAELGVTKERIRQIEARALMKLRKAAEEERIEVPGV